MGAIFKILNSFLGVMAIITCLAAVSIIVYSIVRPDLSRFGIGNGSTVSAEGNETEREGEAEGDPENEAETEDSGQAQAEHQHFYKSERYEEPTCLENGRTIFICDCEDYYYEDIPAEGHKLSEWQQILIPTATLAGERIRTCLACYITVEREILPAIGVTVDPDASPAPSPPPPHVHNYTAAVLTEPTCTVAGIRQFSCACGSFYQEMINAAGHMAADWVIAVEATATKAGVRQRICNVCRTLVDTQQIPKLPNAPLASGAPSGSALPGTSPAPAASPSPSPSVGPHTHTFVYYTSREPTCMEIGSSTGNCSTANCGAEDVKPIPVNKDNHNFNSSGICTRCSFNRNPSPSPSSSP